MNIQAPPPNKARRTLLQRLSRALLPAVTLPWAVLLTHSSHAQAPRVVQDQVTETLMTRGGTLEIHRRESDDGSRSIQLTVDGKVVDTETDYQVVSTSARYPESGPAQVVLLDLTTGGSGCLAFFKLLEIKADGSTVVSKEFGNCSNNARLRLVGGAFHVDISSMGGAKAESWLYQNGKLTRAARAARK